MNVSIWGEDGNTRITIDVHVGDRIEWKRNGQLGTVFGVVVGKSAGGGRLSIRLDEGNGRRFAIKPHICAVWRDGKRIYS